MTKKEADPGFEEIRTLFKETDSRFKETDLKFKETDRKIKELAELFTGQWGKLIESLAESGILKLLQARGIPVSNLARRLESHKNGHHMELDFLLSNEKELVIGEVKTTMGNQDVKKFLKKLTEFLLFFPSFKGLVIYGAMVGLKIVSDADKFAYRNGLFVFKIGGEGTLQLLNDADFKPKDYSPEASEKL